MEATELQQTKGRVLRVKQGYNPNSSSVGSAIPVFLAAAVGAGALTAFLLNLLGTIRGVVSRQKPEAHGPAATAADGEDELT
jgi:hypothetical protein